MSLVAVERATYREMFGVEEYCVHSPGERYLPAFQQWAPIGSTVLDAGCGPGAGARALRAAGYRVALCDLEPYREFGDLPFAAACLWSERDLAAVAYLMCLHGLTTDGKFDYVYCCDVLEHLPPPFTMLAVRNLLSIVRVGVFLSISVMPDGHGVWVGKHLHQTIQPFTAWRDQLNEVGRVIDARDICLAGLYCVVPR